LTIASMPWPLRQLTRPASIRRCAAVREAAKARATSKASVRSSPLRERDNRSRGTSRSARTGCCVRFGTRAWKDFTPQ